MYGILPIPNKSMIDENTTISLFEMWESSAFSMAWKMYLNKKIT